MNTAINHVFQRNPTSENCYDYSHIFRISWLFSLKKSVSNAKGKPTNSEFIAMIADRISLEMNKRRV